MIDDPSQVELVLRAQAGDDQAFTELTSPYYSKICLYLARLISHDDRWRDLDQETFLQAWEKLPELLYAHQFPSWLYRIATNKAMPFLRKEAIRRRLYQPLPGEEEHSLDDYLSCPGPEERVAVEDWLKLALRELEPQCRACLLLCVLGGFSQREIAILLDIGVSTVRGNVCRGREHLRCYRQIERRDS